MEKYMVKITDAAGFVSLDVDETLRAWSEEWLHHWHEYEKGEAVHGFHIPSLPRKFRLAFEDVYGPGFNAALVHSDGSIEVDEMDEPEEY